MSFRLAFTRRMFNLRDHDNLEFYSRGSDDDYVFHIRWTNK